MSYFKKLLQILLTLVAAVQLTACSRTVQWEEEVPLNTGEMIVVKRSGSYTFKSAPGNPLDFGYGPEWRSTIEFTYKGKKYSHTDDVRLILLAIGPDGLPNLIASPGSDWGWQHKYYCVTPYYVQFRPDQIGKTWSWPERIDPWLYALPTNLLFGLVPLAASGNKVTPAERELNNASLTVMYKHLKSIDPTHSIDTCPRRN